MLLLAVTWGCNSVVIHNKEKIYPQPKNWTLFGGNARRDNFRETTLTPPLENHWVYKASSAIGPTLLAVDGVLYFSTLDGKIFALDMETAKQLGKEKSEDGNEATCAYHEGFLYIASRYGDKTLGKYDLSQGKYVWKIDAGDIASEPLVTEEGIFVAALYNHVDKYHLATGEKLWSFKTKDQFHSSPALAQNTLVVGCDDGKVYALNALSGKKRWEFKTGASIYATPCIGEKTVYIGSLDSLFYALDLESGAVKWRFRVNFPIFQAAATDGEKVLFGATDGVLYCLDAQTGKVLWQFQAKSVISTPPTISGKVAYFGSLDHYYYGVNLEDGKELWKFETRGRIRTAPVVWGKYLFGASEDRFLYAFIQSDSLNISYRSIP